MNWLKKRKLKKKLDKVTARHEKLMNVYKTSHIPNEKVLNDLINEINSLADEGIDLQNKLEELTK